MTPNKQTAKGIGGRVLVPGADAYRLKSGTWTRNLAVTVSLLRAEPSLRRLSKDIPIACKEAAAQGYRLVRRYDDAVMYRLVWTSRAPKGVQGGDRAGDRRLAAKVVPDPSTAVAVQRRSPWN